MELMIAMFVFFLLMVITAVLFTNSQAVYRRLNSADTALGEMRKARAALEHDLALAAPAQLNRAAVPASLGGGGKDGEALWFLSPVDPATGQTLRKEDGTPFWQRNILYYLIVPGNHDAVFGTSCAGGVGPNGYDDVCPHKVLIRKVIDSGVPTVASDETTEETLLSTAAILGEPYVSQPDGFSVAGMAEPGLEETRIVATYLLTFFSTSAPPPNNFATELSIDLRALSIDEARREIPVGTTALFDSRFTRQGPVSVFLRN